MLVDYVKRDLNKPLTLYIAGPMRGYVNHNFPAFHLAAKKWAKKIPGCTIFNPAEMDEQAGFNGNSVSLDSSEHLKSCMKRDLDAIMKSDGLVMLHGWENSEGARVEHALAVYLGLCIFYES